MLPVAHITNSLMEFVKGRQKKVECQVSYQETPTTKED